MKKLAIISFVLIYALTWTYNGYCCTSAIFSGKVTADGRPVIWKNRDSGFEHNRVAYVSASDSIKYSFIYLSNSDKDLKEAWSGVNSEGFSIMNTVSYNIRMEGDETPEEKMDREGNVMYRALATCVTLSDFELLLDSLEKPMGLETNFGVIDAAGGAAYYEVNNYAWIKYDVDDVPEGYIIRSNYSFSGRENEGKGYVRYDNATQLINRQIEKVGKISVKFIIDGLSRSYFQSELGVDLLSSGFSWYIDRDFIPRESSVAVTVVQGVNSGDDTSECVFWCALGYPPVSQIIPMKVVAADLIPQDMLGSGENNYSPACERSLLRKADVFSSEYPERGKIRVNLNKVRVILKDIRKVEKRTFRNFSRRMDREQLKEFYEEIEIR